MPGSTPTCGAEIPLPGGASGIKVLGARASRPMHADLSPRPCWPPGGRHLCHPFRAADDGPRPALP
jgi:hypothetical protein